MRKIPEDTHRHKGLRKGLIDELRRKGIQDERVLQALMEVPRHFFLDSALDNYAYEDRAFPIAADQTISQPYTVAYMTSLLDVQPFQKILEIGTGSGYQACVLSQLGAQVYSIERQKSLYKMNRNSAYIRGFRMLKTFYGDGFRGLPKMGPFDAIIITAAAPVIPERLLQQMKVGGRMVLPYGDYGENKSQQMLRITRKSEADFEQEEFDNFTFVPMLKGKQN